MCPHTRSKALRVSESTNDSNNMPEPSATNPVKANYTTGFSTKSVRVPSQVTSQVTIKGDFDPLHHGRVYFGGYTLMLLHFAAINTKIIDPNGIMGTGTTTVLSWGIGWAVAFYTSVIRNKLEGTPYKINRGLRYELILLLCQLFVLAIGAGAFSRFYYGWIASRPEDIFQSLSLVYLERANGLGFGAINDERIIQWWTASATTRFTGLGWWVCELIDPLFHQIPFLSLATFVYSHPTTQNLQHELTSGGVPLIALAAVVGPAQRFFWDLSTCGHTGCDGPYHGFLSHISPLEQMFWHTAPGLIFCLVLFGLYRYHTRPNQRVPFSDAKKDMEELYSVVKTLLFVVVWGFGQVFIAYLMGGEVFREGWYKI